MEQSQIPFPVRPGMSRLASSLLFVVALVAAAGALFEVGDAAPQATTAAGADAMVAAQALAGEFFVLGATVP
jgi:predicted transporter